MTNRYFTSHHVPGDGSCLFHSVSFLLFNDISKSNQMRNQCVSAIINNPQNYCDYLIISPVEYAQILSSPETWAGDVCNIISFFILYVF